MPKPQELCVVKAGGIAYNIWQTVEVTSAVDQVIDHAMLTVAEPSSKATNLAGIKLKPGDPATVTLAGQTVTVSFAGTEDSSLQTSFVIDDTAVTLS